MRINTFEECVKSYNDNFKDKGGWDENDSKKRSDILISNSYSVVVEGDYLESNIAIQWLCENLSAKEDKWTYLWYGKIDYDYGFWEFFFQDKEDCQNFKNEITNFYASVEDKKWKTDGPGNFIDQ